jgi:two-component system, NarL family, invasion response regulator UvrY
MLTVVLAEEHQITRWALARALAQQPDILVLGEAGTVAETLSVVGTMHPDVLVVDTTLPDHAGFDLLHRIRELADAPHVVVLAPVDDPSYAARILDAGAHAYVSKSEPPERLLDALRLVMRGERVVPHGVATSAAGPIALTTRELQVMEMLARGMTNREIARDLSIGVKTVDTHRGHMLKKLRLRNNAEVTRFAVKHGYITA